MVLTPQRAWLAFSATILCLPGSDAQEIFETRVAPLLEAHCLRCHDDKERKGGLSFSTRSHALEGGRRGSAIVPGKPDESFLLAQISGVKPRMPKQADPLPAEAVAVFRQWISSGALWPEGLTLRSRPSAGGWWALKPLERGDPPASASPWVRTPIDAFVLQKLEQNRLAPAPEADRRALIRRLTFDLHGLPPAPEDIDSFVADPSPRAYEDLIDRLLDSPRYGERWGRHWLDVVHYGESHGYDKDKRRPNAWPYRDYVIRAFNEDKPYARFVEEQIAGDVLFPDDPDGIVATGFVAAGPWDFVGHVELREGTVDKAIARSNDRDDMVTAAMSTFASVTAHCARCHDHKFDPITQEDYYSLQAVFAGVDRADRAFDPDPQVHRLRRDLSREKQRLEARLGELQAAAAKITSPEIEHVTARIVEVEKRAGGVDVASRPAEKSPTLGYHGAILPAPDQTQWVQVDLGVSMAIDQVILFPAHVAYGGHPGPGFGFPPRFRVNVSNDAAFSSFETIEDQTSQDFPNPGDAPLGIAGRGVQARYVRVTATRLWKRTDDWIFALAELIVLSGGRNAAAGAVVTSLDSIEAPPGWARKNLVDGATSVSLLAPAGPSPTNGYHSAIFPERDVTCWVEVDLGRPVALDEVVLVPARPTDFPDTPGFGFPARFRVEIAEDRVQAAKPRQVLLDRSTEDFANPGDAPVRIAASGSRARFVRMTATRLWKRTDDFVFALAELQALSGGRNVALGAKVQSQDSIEAGRWGRTYLVDGHSSRTTLETEGEWLVRIGQSIEAASELARLREERASLVGERLDASTREGLASTRRSLDLTVTRLTELPAQRVVFAAANEFVPSGSFTPARAPRPIHLLHRGDVKSPGPLMTAGALACVNELEGRFDIPAAAPEGARRAAFARWLTDPRNPLVWRSIVNRVWQYHFGRGIVDSPNDFGRMGTKPTHPELLDWLAAWFRDTGGSFKDLHRLLLVSAAYRQSSRHDESAALIDSDNRWLWRMNRVRLEAEEVRDALLAASGKLDLAMGGPSVDHFFFKDDHSPTYDYTRFDVDDPASFRRSVYRFIVRSVPDPFMECLDCADPSTLTPKRNNTLTALQALAMLNTPFAVRQAEHFAARLRGLQNSPDRQVEAAFRLALGRLPTSGEAQMLVSHAAEHGLENVCRLILNLNEFLFID